MSALEHCSLCPRACGVDREAGHYGRCHTSSEIRIARVSLHRWEEPCISGENGSGTVFFTGCPLGCVYCQNYNIADGTEGVPVSQEQLTEIFLRQEENGANNINLVTPTHYVPLIAPALREAKRRGLTLPVVYNTSAYETVETLREMEGLVNIYLPDLKYVSTELSAKYSFAPDYFEVASKAVAEMFRQVGTPVFRDLREEDMMARGVIVRHMMLPGQLEDSKRVVKYLWETYGDDIYLSLMSQYTPLPQVKRFPEIDRKVTWDEYYALEDYALDLGISQAFVQEEEASKESFIPDFTSFDVEAYLRGDLNPVS